MSWISSGTAPGAVSRPASMSSTRSVGSSESRAASAAPADPAPTMSTSACSMDGRSFRCWTARCSLPLDPLIEFCGNRLQAIDVDHSGQTEGDFALPQRRGRSRRLEIASGQPSEVLAGDRKGQHSIRINDQFRVAIAPLR